MRVQARSKQIFYPGQKSKLSPTHQPVTYFFFFFYRYIIFDYYFTAEPPSPDVVPWAVTPLPAVTTSPCACVCVYVISLGDEATWRARGRHNNNQHISWFPVSFCKTRFARVVASFFKIVNLHDIRGGSQRYVSVFHSPAASRRDTTILFWNRRSTSVKFKRFDWQLFIHLPALELLSQRIALRVVMCH